MEICLKPVAYVRNSRTAPIDDGWEAIQSEIVLADDLPEAVLLGIDGFSHLEILYHFDQVPEASVAHSGRPRGNPAYPLTGIFAQRKKDRPNRLGLCTVELVSVAARALTVRRLDAIDGTPVLDIKPVFREFAPRGPVRQPAWVDDLMQAYWH